MKSMTARLLPMLAFVLASPWVWAAPGDGIPGTLHDFSGEAAIGGENPGTCTYCHTPHRAQSQALLWNQEAGAQPASYSWVGSTATTGGTGYATITTATNTGPSVKCLSCHDGSAGVGDIGWFNAQNPAVTLSVGATYVVNQVAPADMTGNHPVSMPFPFGAVANTYNSQTNGTSAVASDWIADPEALGIRLFNDTAGDGTGIGAGSAAVTTGIECSSCHDPHNGAGATGPFFLRGDLGGNAATYICAKCHDR